MSRDHKSLILLFLRKVVRYIGHCRRSDLSNISFRRFVTEFIIKIKDIINDIGDDLFI